MPAYSRRSRARLATCHPDIRLVFDEVIRFFDHTIVVGHRTTEEQARLYAQGRTEPGRIVTQIDGVTRLSKHNLDPAEAVDAAPYDSERHAIDWADRERFHLFAGVVLATARQLGVTLRWGGDWDRDTEVEDNSFDDLPHFELFR